MPICPTSSTVTGRADLLRALVLADQDPKRGEGLAAAAGYAADSVASQPFPFPLEEPEDLEELPLLPRRSPQPPPQTDNTTQNLRATFWVVTERKALPQRPGDDLAAAVKPEPLAAADWMPNRCGLAPPFKRIVSNARLMPALKTNLAAWSDARLDVQRLVTQIANEQLQRQLPLVKAKAWASRIVLVLDYSNPLRVYHEDMDRLATDLARWCGQAALQVRRVSDSTRPMIGWRACGMAALAGSSQEVVHRDWAPLPARTHVLLVSDLGLLAEDRGQTSLAWAECTALLASQGAQLQVWSPIPLGLKGSERPAYPLQKQAWAAMDSLPTVHWSSAARLRTHPLHTASAHHTQKREAQAEHLRAALVHAMRVEPQLLRAIRLASEVGEQDAGVEQLVWDHPDLGKALSARAVRADCLGTYAAQWHKHSSPGQQLAVLDTIRAYYAQRNPMLVHAASLAWAAHVKDDVRLQRADHITKAMKVMQGLVAAPWDVTGLDKSEMQAFLSWQLRYADPQTRTFGEAYMSQFAVALHKTVHGDVPITESYEGLSTQALARALGLSGDAVVEKWLCQDDRGWLMLLSDKPHPSRLLSNEPVVFEAMTVLNGTRLPVFNSMRKTLPRREIGLVRLPWGTTKRITGGYWKYAHAAFPPELVDGTILLETASEQITIEEVQRPAWALEWARDAGGLYALAPCFAGRPMRVDFPLPVADPLGFRSLAALTTRALRGKPIAIGLDSFGLCARLQLAFDAFQNLRYLPPGRFLMGSPVDEDGRFADEGPQHWVTLTEGLWLADTVCTQGLWMAVMGRSRVHFRGGLDLPVENVSWYDVQEFLQRLRAYLPPGVEACLPTEAEWEYACRAGSTSAFSFGDTISTGQVNYDGQYPYGDAPKGEFRKRTVAAKALPSNAWGLYQMHGNVWEWCADGARTYMADAASDPKGPTTVDSDARFAVRGGSWRTVAKDARSARRSTQKPERLNAGLGFRFALRSREQVGDNVPGWYPHSRPAGGPGQSTQGGEDARNASVSRAPDGAPGRGGMSK